MNSLDDKVLDQKSFSYLNLIGQTPLTFTSEKLIAGGITISGSEIDETGTNSGADLSFNFVGFNGGTTQFRNVRIFDGKNAGVATFTGSTKSLEVFGSVTSSYNSSDGTAGLTQAATATLGKSITVKNGLVTVFA